MGESRDEDLGSDQLESDLYSMCGVWRDHLSARGPRGEVLTWDEYGGVPGAFPYENLVYCDFDGERWLQTNVVLSGREHHERSFTATVSNGRLTFDTLGPDAPPHVGISGGPGIIWFVSESNSHPGLHRYAEPDMIRLQGDQRWRDTVLWRDGALARVLHVAGERLSRETSQPHELDPRGQDSSTHAQRSVTTNYQSKGNT